MKHAMLAAVGVLFVLIEVSVAPYASIRSIRPDIVLAYVVIVGIVAGPVEAGVVGLAAGFVEDACSGQFLGLHMLTRVVVAFASGLAHDLVFQDRTAVPVVGVFLGAIASGVMNLFLLSSFGVRLPVSAAALRMVLCQAFYSAALAPLVSLLVARLARAGRGRRSGERGRAL